MADTARITIWGPKKDTKDGLGREIIEAGASADGLPTKELRRLAAKGHVVKHADRGDADEIAAAAIAKPPKAPADAAKQEKEQAAGAA